MRAGLGWTMLAAFLFSCGCGNKAYDAAFGKIEQACVANDFWVRIHGIEYLHALGEWPLAKKYCKALSLYDSVPQKRIGYWRVSYRLAREAPEKLYWIEKIKKAYYTVDGPDRVHAAETLAKLGISLYDPEDSTVAIDCEKNDLLSCFVAWSISLPSKHRPHPATNILLQRLNAADPTVRKIAAYALGFTGIADTAGWMLIKTAALEEARGTIARPYLLGTAYQLYDAGKDTDNKSSQRIEEALMAMENSPRKEDQMELCRALAVHCTEKQIPCLVRLMQKNTAAMSDTDRMDVQAAAAYAFIVKRNTNNH